MFWSGVPVNNTLCSCDKQTQMGLSATDAECGRRGGKEKSTLLFSQRSQRSTYQVQHLQAVQQLAVAIFKAVSLVNDDATPGDFPQLGAVGQHHLKGCDQGVKLVGTGDQMVLQTKIKVN